MSKKILSNRIRCLDFVFLFCKMASWQSRCSIHAAYVAKDSLYDRYRELIFSYCLVDHDPETKAVFSLGDPSA